MSNDRDDKLNKDTEAAEFTLEEILAEFGSGPKPSGPDLPWPEAKRRPPPPENVVPFPTPAPEAPGGEDPDGPEEDAEPEREKIILDDIPDILGGTLLEQRLLCSFSLSFFFFRQ